MTMAPAAAIATTMAATNSTAPRISIAALHSQLPATVARQRNARGSRALSAPGSPLCGWHGNDRAMLAPALESTVRG